jgi:hypothetical protein
MIGLTVAVDSHMPADAVYLRLVGPGLRVTVHPKVEAKALAALEPELAVAVADELARLKGGTA